MKFKTIKPTLKINAISKKIIIDKNLVGNNKNPTYNFYCNGGDNSLKKILTNNFKINTI